MKQHDTRPYRFFCAIFLLLASSCDRPITIPDAVAVDTVAVPVSEEMPTEPPPAAATQPIASDGWSTLAELGAYNVNCATEGELDLKIPLGEFSKTISAQQIMYKSEPLSDCSGIFHRTLQHVGSRCENYEIPAVEIRTTRGLAKWYAERKELIMIEDAEAMAELIKPGAVMFYGTNGRRYAFPADSSLVVDTDIEHMGVVVDVERDEAGELINYHLFHGRRTGLVAAVTGTETEGKYNHLRREKPNHPPFGNGNQQWVAVARILNPAMLAAEE